MLSHIFQSLNIEASKSPKVTLFQKFRENYSSIATNDLDNFCKLTFEPELQTLVDEVIVLMSERLQNKKFAYRGDYTSCAWACCAWACWLDSWIVHY